MLEWNNNVHSPSWSNHVSIWSSPGLQKTWTAWALQSERVQCRWTLHSRSSSSCASGVSTFLNYSTLSSKNSLNPHNWPVFPKTSHPGLLLARKHTALQSYRDVVLSCWVIHFNFTPIQQLIEYSMFIPFQINLKNEASILPISQTFQYFSISSSHWCLC